MSVETTEKDNSQSQLQGNSQLAYCHSLSYDIGQLRIMLALLEERIAATAAQQIMFRSSFQYIAKYMSLRTRKCTSL